MKNILVKSNTQTLKLQIDETTTIENLILLIKTKLQPTSHQFVIKYNGKDIGTTDFQHKTVNELSSSKIIYINLVNNNPIESKPVDIVRKLCVTNCGFYGDPNSFDMCSKCLAHSVKTANKLIEKNKQDNEEESEPIIKIDQTNHGKCWKCNKNIGLLGFKCKCLYTFCALHRFYTDHDCTYDHIKNDRKRLKLELEKQSCKGTKINKI
jgi:hypothetical protein